MVKNSKTIPVRIVSAFLYTDISEGTSGHYILVKLCDSLTDEVENKSSTNSSPIPDSTSSLSSIPNGALSEILKKLRTSDLRSMMLVSKQMNAIIKGNPQVLAEANKVTTQEFSTV